MDRYANPETPINGRAVNEDELIRWFEGRCEVNDEHMTDLVNPIVRDVVRDKRNRNDTGPVLIWEVLEKTFERWLASQENADADLDNHQDNVVAETAEEPPNLVMPLLSYQKEWLAWALHQEESHARGGILADEMGMGKTIQAIALVLAKQAYHGEVGGVQSPPSSSSGLPEVKATLVICPVVAVMQWVKEIDRSTLRGSNKVLIYHGANRGRTVHEFSDYDFVITTYSVVEAEYRKFNGPLKQKCFWCNKLIYGHKLYAHQMYLCAANASKTYKPVDDRNEAFGAAGTSTNASDGAKEGRGAINSALHSVRWNRIILDEAHYIRNHRGNTTKAVLALSSSYKWALSGTPFQNRVEELYSLICFLRIKPYCGYFCMDCDCTRLDYSSETECLHCSHASMRHFSWWNKYIAKPIQSQGNTESGRGAMILLKHRILKRILLRRTKKGRSTDLALPPRMIILSLHSLDENEDDYYTSLYNESQAQFNTYVAEGTVMNNYANIFDLITRLRQATDHPYLVVYSKTAMSRNTSVVADANNNDVICGLRHELVEDPVVSAEHGQGDKDTKTSIEGFKRSSIINRIRLDNFRTSTKIEALKEEIRFMVERDGSAKGIVFSQFTSFLDLIRYSLQKSGVQCVQLDGSMSMKARDTAIKRFNEDPNCRIILMSLRSGGVALNLTVASHVFLMDPSWNPAAERQAHDRIHRIGQHKPTRVVKFVIEGTIEERILKLQEKKELVFEGTIGGSDDALGRLTEADMRFLFVA